MIKLEQKKGETRKYYLLRIAIEYIDQTAGYDLPEGVLFYDEAECDGFCLAEDLRTEFGISDKVDL